MRALLLCGRSDDGLDLLGGFALVNSWVPRRLPVVVLLFSIHLFGVGFGKAINLFLLWLRKAEAAGPGPAVMAAAVADGWIGRVDGRLVGGYESVPDVEAAGLGADLAVEAEMVGFECVRGIPSGLNDLPFFDHATCSFVDYPAALCWRAGKNTSSGKWWWSGRELHPHWQPH
jgi:hypothetical protein